MRILSKPQQYGDHCCSHALSDPENVDWDSIKYQESIAEDPKFGPCAVLRCHGTPLNTHNKNVSYDYDILLRAEDVLAALLSFPPDLIALSVAATIRNGDKNSRYINGDGCPREMGSPAVEDVLYAVSAISSGLATYMASSENQTQRPRQNEE